MKSRPLFKAGQRVVLPANPKEGWKEEHGVVIGEKACSGSTYLVRVDECFRGSGDDGLREVQADDLRKEEP